MLGSRIESGELTELAAREARQAMRVSPEDLPRLAEFVIAGSAEDSSSGEEASWLATEVKFEDGPEGFPRVHLSTTGRLALVCQRCLQPVIWQVELETSLTVLRSEDQADCIQDPFDSVLMGDEGLDIRTLVEDEVLAALPIAVVHGPESECGQAAAELEPATDAARTSRPFADLASLMGQTREDRKD